ncbi:MAG: hypothetical protein RL497_1424 [Pseudomonadota bacterium]
MTGRIRQRGATIISLLVGMVVSMLAILASLSMFHNLVRVSAEAKTDARQEGDLSLAALRLETELQAAGFNMNRAPAAGRNLDFLAVPALNGRSDVAWRFNDGVGFICRRATSRISAEGLYRLEIFNARAAVCTAAWALTQAVVTDDDPATTAWVWAERLVELRLQNLNAAAAPVFSKPLIEFATAVNDRACMPFGAAATLPAGAVAAVHPELIIGVFDVATVYRTPAAGAPAPSANRFHTLCMVNVVQ